MLGWLDRDVAEEEEAVGADDKRAAAGARLIITLEQAYAIRRALGVGGLPACGVCAVGDGGRGR